MDGLEYSGIPRKPDKRELKDSRNRLLSNNAEALTQAPIQDPAEAIFDDLARVLIKGEKLKAGLGNMNPAGFIPVEEEAPVRLSIQRIDESANVNIITFGQFKEACEHIAGVTGNLNEEFVLGMNSLDPNKINKEVKKSRKGGGDNTNDFIDQFISGLSPFAGLMIMGYLGDVAGANSFKFGIPDGPNSGQQVPLWHAQGLGPGLSLLIELGINTVGFEETANANNKILKDDVRKRFKELADDPSQRRTELEGIGLDYDAIKSNRKFDDSMAVKQYSLIYIAGQVEDLNYDHWAAWLNVLENQEMVKGAIALAPMRSNRWKKFYDTNDSDSLTEEFIDENDIDVLDTLETGLVSGLESYFTSLLSTSSEHYDAAFLSYSMEIDSRLMCCILWFLGPLDTDTLEDIAQILRLLARNVKLDVKNMVAYMTDTAVTALINMLTGYINELINRVFSDIADKLFKIPGSDWEVATQYCIGIDVLFNLISKAFSKLTVLINDLLKEIESILTVGLKNKSRFQIETAAERKYLITLAALIDSIISEIDLARRKCQFDDENEDPKKINDLAAQAAVDFVSTKVSELYPVLDLPEDTRRKFFSGLDSFKTQDLGLEVPGSDDVGAQKDLTQEDVVHGCGEGQRALGGLTIGKKIADIMEGKI